MAFPSTAARSGGDSRQRASRLGFVESGHRRAECRAASAVRNAASGGRLERVPDPADHHRRSLYISVRRTAPIRYSAPSICRILMRAARAALRRYRPAGADTVELGAVARMGAGVRRARHRARRRQSPLRLRKHFVWPTRGRRTWEKDRILTFLNRQREMVAERQAKGKLSRFPAHRAVNPVDAAALVDLCLTLLNSNEFVYRF